MLSQAWEFGSWGAGLAGKSACCPCGRNPGSTYKLMENGGLPCSLRIWEESQGLPELDCSIESDRERCLTLVSDLHGHAGIYVHTHDRVHVNIHT